MQCSAVEGGKSGRTVKGIYGWWIEVKVMLKLVCNNCGVTILETRCSTFFPLVLPLVCALLLTVVGLLCIVFYLGCIFVTSCVLFYYVCIAVLNTLVAGLLAGSQYPEGPATGHLGTGVSWFPCAYKWMLRWFPRLQVATACFPCSPPNLNLVDPYFVFM